MGSADPQPRVLGYRGDGLGGPRRNGAPAAVGASPGSASLGAAEGQALMDAATRPTDTAAAAEEIVQLEFRLPPCGQ